MKYSEILKAIQRAEQMLAIGSTSEAAYLTHTITAAIDDLDSSGCPVRSLARISAWRLCARLATSYEGHTAISFWRIGSEAIAAIEAVSTIDSIEQVESIFKCAQKKIQPSQASNSCWTPGTKNCDCPSCGGFND